MAQLEKESHNLYFVLVKKVFDYKQQKTYFYCFFYFLKEVRIFQDCKHGACISNHAEKSWGE